MAWPGVGTWAMAWLGVGMSDIGEKLIMMLFIWLIHGVASLLSDFIHLVQHTLGHASLGTTARYVHCKPGTSSAEFISPC
jgi:hypothetical protein